MKMLPKMVFVFGVVLLLATSLPRISMLSHMQTSPPTSSEVREAIQFDPRILVSSVVLAASLYVILSKRYTPQDKHWAYATVGTILGFWLRI